MVLHSGFVGPDESEGQIESHSSSTVGEISPDNKSDRDSNSEGEILGLSSRTFRITLLTGTGTSRFQEIIC